MTPKTPMPEDRADWLMGQVERLPLIERDFFMDCVAALVDVHIMRVVDRGGALERVTRAFQLAPGDRVRGVRGYSVLIVQSVVQHSDGTVSVSWEKAGKLKYADWYPMHHQVQLGGPDEMPKLRRSSRPRRPALASATS